MSMYHQDNDNSYVSSDPVLITDKWEATGHWEIMSMAMYTDQSRIGYITALTI